VTNYNDFQCLESTNSLYVDKKPDGYDIKPCCLYKGDTGKVKTIEQLLDNPTINKIKKGFTENWKNNPSCNDCVRNEKMGKSSQRLRSLDLGYDGKIVRWDIRPGNTCNLKCAMCHISNSSKWLEDIDILTKYTNNVDTLRWTNNILNDARSRESLDWNWIYERCIDTAQFIYIAGGEPFYMKNVQEFLNKLSSNQWNQNNTRIQIQTNGVSNTPKFLDILSRFKRLEFNISVDGWNKVNELIRFPTDHNDWIKNVNQLMQLNPYDIFFNITVQVMNLPNIDELIKNLKDRWNGKYEIHKLYYPLYLSLNALNPYIIKAVSQSTKIIELQNFCNDYTYNENLNKTMQEYLLDLDKKRKTNSKKIIPWCFINRVKRRRERTRL
jgi:organic radical activating enzyme